MDNFNKRKSKLNKKKVNKDKTIYNKKHIRKIQKNNLNVLYK